MKYQPKTELKLKAHRSGKRNVADETIGKTVISQVQKSRPQDRVYSKEELEVSLAKMRAVSATFYSGAVQTNCHPFIEFCGLMQEHIKVCESAHRDGVDFTQANTHSGKALPMQTYEAAYIGEKLGCIYGPSLSDPKLFQAFIRAMNLPFDVKVTPKIEADEVRA